MGVFMWVPFNSSRLPTIQNQEIFRQVEWIKLLIADLQKDFPLIRSPVLFINQ